MHPPVRAVSYFITCIQLNNYMYLEMPLILAINFKTVTMHSFTLFLACICADNTLTGYILECS